MAAMQIVTTQQALLEAAAHWRRAGERIAFVPTMGNLHDGHLRLIDAAARTASRSIASIFVNPLQFGAGEDLDSYPRSFDADCDRLDAAGVDLLYAPDVADMYPHGPATIATVEVPALADVLCGASRPGHFRGVATVVLKLFNRVQPHVALFGEKDYQQLLVIRRMVRDLDVPVEIIGVPTVREADGLAMSSRNGYLNTDERARAPLLYRTLCETVAALADGSEDYGALERRATRNLDVAGLRPDYYRILARADLSVPTPQSGELGVFAAVFLGRTRLIDNLAVTLPSPAD
jgi:pantoate--beta-alanine ligase